MIIVKNILTFNLKNQSIMKTKKFFMTTLLVMGMVIAKAANGFPPELVLVSQPVLTYNANSVTVYYDVQNIGDYTYRGDVYLYLDPDDGYYYAKKYVRVCPGRIKRIAVSIPAYRPNPSWVYTVMPYYELGNELYSFTTFEYFEPVRFCWYGYRDEPWVVIHVGPKPHYYHRPSPYRFYYDGYYVIAPPPPGGYPMGYFDGRPPLNPVHHTYAYHHSHGGYPANYHPVHETPGYNHATPSNSGSSNATVVRPSGANTPGSMSSRPSNSGSSNTNNNATVTRPSGNHGSNTSGATTRPSTTTTTTNSSSSGRSNNSSSTNRTDSGSSSVSRPSNDSSSRTGTSSNGSSSRVSGSSSSSRSGNSNSSSRSSSSNSSSRSGDSNSSSRSNSSSGSPRTR